MEYFDNAASTRVLEEAAKAAMDVMLNSYGNASSLHRLGLESYEILNSCRKEIAKVYLRQENEIIFTSGATESSNIAILGTSKRDRKKKKIITSSVEHKATENCLNYLEQKGYEIVRIKERNNVFYAKDFVDCVDENTLMISVMHVNNENGLILPVEDIARMAKGVNKEILVHVDAAQSFLKLPLKLDNIDLLSASGHKVNAPKGIGFLFAKEGTKISPISYGGGQEFMLRPGTQATALIKALEVAVKYHVEKRSRLEEKYRELKDIFVESLKENERIYFNFNESCIPSIVNISVKGIRSQVFLQALEEKGFLVSSGAACSKNKDNKTLINLGYSKERADTAIRISFGIDTTKDSVLELIDAINYVEKTVLKYC